MANELPVLTAKSMRLRPFSDEDSPLLAAALNEESVRRWWTPKETDSFPDDFRNDGRAFTVWIDDSVAGWIGFENEFEPDWRHAAIDIFLSASFQGQGHGAVALSLVIDWLLHTVGHHRVTIDPAVANERAIHVYSSLGFKPVGVMRQYEMDSNGAWHDNLLMDLLIDEFQPAL